jgi:hypothetical protein
MADSPSLPDHCSHAWTLVGVGKLGRVFQCKVCRVVWTPDKDKEGVAP